MFKSIVLVKRPDSNFPNSIEDIFKIVEKPINQPLPPKNILIKVYFPIFSDYDSKILCITIDPVLRVWLSGAKTYIDQVELFGFVPSFGLGVCIESNSQHWKRGELLLGVLEWSEYCVRSEKNIQKLPQGFKENSPNLTLFFSVYGVTGVTAFLALEKEIDSYNLPQNTGQNKTLLVSSAAGSTGSYVIQIAKQKGFRVVGVASSNQKCDYVISLGASNCIAYNQFKDLKSGNIDVDKLSLLIQKTCPEGIDVYFDNIGEEMLDAVLPVINKFGNIILCGATATYNQWKQRKGLKNSNFLIQNSIKTKGILYYGDKSALLEGLANMIQLVNEGHIQYREEVLNGLDKAPLGLKKVYLGENLGKIIIKIDPSFQIAQPKL